MKRRRGVSGGGSGGGLFQAGEVWFKRMRCVRSGGEFFFKKWRRVSSERGVFKAEEACFKCVGVFKAEEACFKRLRRVSREGHAREVGEACFERRMLV